MPFLITHMQLYWNTKRYTLFILKDKANIICELTDILDIKIYRI